MPAPSNHEPRRPRTHRALVFAGWAAGMLVVTLSLVQALRIGWHPDGVPSWDAADYLNRALRVRDALVADDSARLAGQVIVPNVHPPLHPLLLGGWLAVWGPSLADAAVLQVGLLVAALALLPLLGHRADSKHGRWAGLGAAVLTSLSLEHQRLLAPPMSENLALLATVCTLLLATPPPNSLRRDVLVGLVVCAATLVRWNLGPMLLVPLVLAAIGEPGGARRLTARALVWAAPTALLVGAWAWARPDLVHALSAYFRNVDSGRPGLRLEDLLWLPSAFATEVVGVPFVAGALGVVVAAALVVDRARASFVERLLRWFAVVAVVALLVHPYKQVRNLHVVVPIAWTAALLPLARVLARGAAGAGLAPLTWALAGTLLWGVLYRHAGTRGAMGDPDVRDDAAAAAALDALVAHADGATRVVVSGQHPRLSTPVFETWFRLRGAHPEILYDRGCPETRGCVPEATRRLSSTAEGRAATVFAVISSAPRTGSGGAGPGGLSAGGAPPATDAAAIAGWLTANQVDQVAVRALGDGTTMSIHRAGGPPG